MSIHNTKKNDLGQPNSLAEQGVFEVWKEPGETLAVLLRRFREEQGFSSEEKITYAGRLDPMAEGIVPLLVGEARFQKDRLLGARKTYKVDILLGISTDTADMLGVITMMDIGKEIAEESITAAVESLQSVTELPYPEYSSRPVEGKPLFVHARAGRKVQVPMKKVSIYSMEMKGVQVVPLSQVLEENIATIRTVQGDFRQEEIVGVWESLLERKEEVQIVSVETTVSSGTYMRSLAERMGEILGVPALALKIVRTEIGGK